MWMWTDKKKQLSPPKIKIWGYTFPFKGGFVKLRARAGGSYRKYMRTLFIFLRAEPKGIWIMFEWISDNSWHCLGSKQLVRTKEYMAYFGGFCCEASYPDPLPVLSLKYPDNLLIHPEVSKLNFCMSWAELLLLGHFPEVSQQLYVLLWHLQASNFLTLPRKQRSVCDLSAKEHCQCAVLTREWPFIGQVKILPPTTITTLRPWTLSPLPRDVASSHEYF